jgi:hypothetical protein
MKMSKFALSAMIAGACCAGTAFGQTNRTAPRYYPASYYSYYQDGAAAQAPAPIASASDAAPGASACCDKGPACDVAAICDGKGSSCDSACGCGDGSCDGACGGCGAKSTGLFGLGMIGTGRKLDDPWKLTPNGIGNTGINVGGWNSTGYHNKANPFSFNTYADRLQVGQQWFWAEKIASGKDGIGFGGRIDYLYGTDAPDTQAFGVTAPNFDNRWVNGPNALGYGHAMPQLYGEVAVGDLSAKVGRFFTIVGNEVVQATGNFFYSRQFTFYNAEPFTHTGALTTYNVDADTQIYNGYVTGWDSAFRDNGDAYLGGFKKKLNDTFSVLYSTCMGRFGDANIPGQNERGQIHSVILTAAMSEKLTYISQTDSLYTSNVTGAIQRHTFGNINYLIYKVNDRVSLGQRFEWFNYGGAGFANAANPNGVRNDDNYNFTSGINYRAHANLLIRPEVRWVWDRQRFGFNENNASSQAAVGGDMVFTF